VTSVSKIRERAMRPNIPESVDLICLVRFEGDLMPDFPNDVDLCRLRLRLLFRPLGLWTINACGCRARLSRVLGLLTFQPYCVWKQAFVS